MPPELLEIEEHQPVRGLLPEDKMTALQPLAIRPPVQIASMAQNALANGSMFHVTQLHNIRLTVNPQLMSVDARMLPISNLCYQGALTVPGGAANQSRLRDGRWQIKGKKFFRPGHLEGLAVIEIGLPQGQQAQQARLAQYESLSSAMSLYGMTPGANQRAILVQQAADTAQLTLQNAYQRFNAKGRLPVILVVFRGSPARQEDYADVKRAFETVGGINTVCLTQRNVVKLTNPGFVANLVLKFNIKALRDGGVNHVPDATVLKVLHGSNDTMVMGADVTHPAWELFLAAPLSLR